MKKKVLAVLLAVCMIVSSGVLMVSAANYAKGTYVEKVNDSGDLVVGNIRAIAKSAFNIDVTVTPKTGISLNSGTTEVTASNVDDILSFKSSTATLTYASNLANYYDVSGTISGNNITVNFTPEEANTLNDIYSVDTAFDETTFNEDYLKQVSAVKYILSDMTVAATVSKWVTKLASVTMGVRFFGKTYNNLVASEIAKITATVTRQGSKSSVSTISVTNTIEDLMPNDKVHLEASLKDPAEKDFYGFYCWVDGSGNVVGTENTYDITMDGNAVAVYATFVELKNRVTIDYKSNGNGKVLYNEAREIFNGDAQISVMCDKPATFTFVPDEGYEVAKVVIDGKKNVASFGSVDFTNLKSILASLGVLVNATNKETYSYTFTADELKFDNGNHTIEVTFQKVTPLETPSGKDLPIVDAEGITLANADDVAAEAKAEKDAKGTTVPAEDGAAANGGSAATGIVNPATGSASAIAVFAVLSVAAGAAFVTAKKKND